jgi:hypothetical protein
MFRLFGLAASKLQKPSGFRFRSFKFRSYRMTTQLPGFLPANFQDPLKRNKGAFARRRQEHLNSVRRIPVEVTDDATRLAIEADASKAIHNVTLDELDGRFNFMFAMCALDNEIEHMLDAAFM